MRARREAIAEGRSAFPAEKQVREGNKGKRKKDSRLIPPSKFIPAGFVAWAQFAPETPDFARKKTKGLTGAKREGVRYEKKAQRYLNELVNTYPGAVEYIESPWLVYKSGSLDNKQRFCQPDGLIVSLAEKHITIVEIKLQHTQNAWWQIRELYEPVLRRIYTNFSFSAVEVVRWLDATVYFPEDFVYCEDIFAIEKGKFGVHIQTNRS